MEKQNNLTQGNIFKVLMRFMLPVLAALFLQSLYGGVDLLIVGRFAATADVSGVATGSLITGTLTQIIVGLATGITILVGEKIGEGRPDEAGDVIGCGICMFALAGVIIMALMGLCASFFARILQAPDEAFSQTVAYIRICGLGAIFIVAYNVLGAVFRGLGDSRTPLVTVAIACVFNILGDLILVAGLGMGAAGAALATVCAQAISVVISLLLIRRRELPFSLTRGQVKLSGRIAGKVLKLGAPLALQELCIGGSFIVIQSIVNSFGVVISAAVGVADKVSAFIMLIPSAYMQSMSAFVAQNLGAGDEPRAKKALKLSAISAFFAGIVLFCVQFFFGAALASIFSSDPEVIPQAHLYLKACGIDSLFSTMMFCFVGYFNGCEESLFVMAQGLIGALLVRAPIVYLMSLLPNTNLFFIGLGTPAASAVQLALCVGYYFYRERRRRIMRG